MKIKIIIPYHQNLYDTLLALERKNEIKLVTTKRVRKIPDEIPHKILRSWTVAKKVGAVMSPLGLLREITKKTDYVIVKHLFYPSNFIVLLLCKIKGIPYIINVQKFATSSSTFKNLFFHILLWFIGRNTRVMANTREGFLNLKGHFKKARYVPICINPSSWKTRKTKKLTKSMRLLCVSKYMKRKNLDYLIKAIEVLIHKYPGFSINLTIIGSAFTWGKVGRHLLPEKKVYQDIKNLVIKKGLQKKYHTL